MAAICEVQESSLSPCFGSTASPEHNTNETPRGAFIHSLTLKPLPSTYSSDSPSPLYYIFSNFQCGLELDSEDIFHDFRNTNSTPFRRRQNATSPTHGLLSWFDPTIRPSYSNCHSTTVKYLQY